MGAILLTQSYFWSSCTGRLRFELLGGQWKAGVGPRVGVPSRESDPKIEGVLEAGLTPQNTLNKFS